MSQPSAERRAPSPAATLLDRLIVEQGTHPITSADELKADVWQSDEEVAAFLANVRSWRDADLG